MHENDRISVIIPVLHESDGINKLIAHLLSLPADQEPEIVLVDGDPAGSTLKAVKNGQHIVTAIAPQGRAAQMNRGASVATGGILLFLHADTFLPWNAFELIRTGMAGGRCVAGAFELGILSDRKIFRMTERYVALRTRLTRIPFGDQAIFVRKTYFDAIGGYRDIPVMEDVDLMRRIKEKRGLLCLVPGKVMTSPRRWEREGVVRATMRNWMLQLLYSWGVPPDRLARFYRHRTARDR